MNTNSKLFLTAFVSLGVGFAAGYFLGTKDGEVTIVPAEPVDPNAPEQLTLLEGNEPKVELLEIPKFISVDEPVEIVADATPVRDEEPQSVNIFTNEDDWNWDVEDALRSMMADNVPFVIHQEEFIESESGFRQGTLTFYAGDEVVADELDTPIYNWKTLLGELKWGHGSRDSNVVYIRNPAVKMEWEVLLSTGHFAIEAMGLEAERDAELKHSTPRRFRED